MKAIILFTALVLTSAPALAAERFALVIGNGNYGGASTNLPNAPRDAQTVTTALRDVGFDVTTALDADLGAMKQALLIFKRKLAASPDDTVALFYYAGHGIQSRGQNYLLPVRTPINDVDELDLSALKADDVMKQLHYGGASTNIIVLDACRNNPFAAQMRGATRSAGGAGLAPMDAPEGSIIAYSTSPGRTAADGTGTNSPFSLAFSQAILEPGLDIDTVFRRVKADVVEATDNAQRPWHHTDLTRAFFFVPPLLPDAQPVASAPIEPDMVALPGGDFIMGLPVGGLSFDTSAMPSRTVKVSPFAIARTEITKNQYAAFATETGRASSGDCEAPGTGQHPAACVSWTDAKAYADWLAAKTGKPYRLLSEAEWEYAARGGSSLAYHWGKGAPVCSKDAENGAQFSACNEASAAVARFRPNAFGLHDMHGNAAEWVADCFHAGYFKAPSDGGVWEGGDCARRMVRGGSWADAASALKSTTRAAFPANTSAPKIGFRVAMDVVE